VEDLLKIFDLIKTIAGSLAVFGLTFELLPIKIAPLKWIGDRLNKNVNDKIDKIQAQVNRIEYENDMKDLRNVKSRLHQYGLAIRNGEILTDDIIKSAFDDLDVYDGYKDTYKYMIINGKKVKINGEVEADRHLITTAHTSNKRRRK